MKNKTDIQASTQAELGLVLAEHFPALRRPCTWANPHDEFDAGRAHPTYDRKHCTINQDRPLGSCPGWVPDVTLAKLVDILIETDWSIYLWSPLLGGEKRVWIHSTERVGQGGIYYKDTWEEGLIQTLIDQVQAV